MDGSAGRRGSQRKGSPGLAQMRQIQHVTVHGERFLLALLEAHLPGRFHVGLRARADPDRIGLAERDGVRDLEQRALGLDLVELGEILRIQLLLEDLLKQQPSHREFVIRTEPAVDMDRADFGDSTGFSEDVDDSHHVAVRQRGNVLAEVDGEVGFSVGLIAGDRAAGNRRQRLALSWRPS